MDQTGTVCALPPEGPIAAAVQANLSEKRWRHTCAVRRQAAALAARWGADVKKAEMAALLHDYLKETSPEQLLQIYSNNVIIKDTGEKLPLLRRSRAAWHGICAALILPERFGICDEQIISAVDCHTCGKAGMSLLDKILYLADMTGEDRDFPGVEVLRTLAVQDLDAAMRRALHSTVDHVAACGGVLDEESLAALRDLEEKI